MQSLGIHESHSNNKKTYFQYDYFLDKEALKKFEGLFWDNGYKQHDIGKFKHFYNTNLSFLTMLLYLNLIPTEWNLNKIFWYLGTYFYIFSCTTSKIESKEDGKT